MNHADLHYADLLQIGRLIQSREVSSEEVTQALLTRIATLDPKLHSLCVPDGGSGIGGCAPRRC